MIKYSNTIEDFYNFQLTESDILSLSGKWIEIQTIIDEQDMWDEVFDS